MGKLLAIPRYVWQNLFVSYCSEDSLAKQVFIYMFLILKWSFYHSFKNEDKDGGEEKKTAAPTQEDIFGEELDVSSDEDDAVTQVIIYYKSVNGVV